MHQKDFILRQIEMLSILLRRFVSEINLTSTDKDIQTANDELLKKGLNVLEILKQEELDNYLIKNRIPISSYCDIARYLNKVSIVYNSKNKTLSKSYLKSSKLLMNLFEEKTKSVFFKF